MGGNYERSVFRQMEEMEKRMNEKIRRLEEKHAEHIIQIERHYEELLAKKQAEVEYWKNRAEIAERKVVELEAKVVKLEAEIARLKSKNENDSHNSSLPPSTDQKHGKAQNEYNERKKGQKTSGGQPGHTGKTLRMNEMKERLQKMNVPIEIEEIGDPGTEYTERLVVDLQFTVKATIKRFHADDQGKISIPPEYQNEVTYGDGIKSFSVFEYAQGVQSLERLEEMLRILSGNVLHPSQGTIENWLADFTAKASADVKRIEDSLLSAPQIATDGTCISENGRQTYIRNFSNRDCVIYVPMDTKGHKALEQIELLTKYTGILLHDHESALYRYGFRHAECNVHLIRYLIKNTEDTGHKWSQKMISLLLSSNEYRNKQMDMGAHELNWVSLQRIEKRYDEILDSAKKESEETPCKYAWATKEEKTLINRLIKYKREHLLFLHDFCVSFDNNMSERDLRKCKNRQKMSGGFRTNKGKQMYCVILSILETCKRQGRNMFEAFCSVFASGSAFA